MNMSSHPHAAPKASEWGLSFRAAFLLLALVFLTLFHQEAWWKTFALIFVGIVLEALPFMLLGSMVSGFVEVFTTKERLAAILPRRRVLLTFLAAGMGVVFPVCECAVIPVVRRFLRKGVPLSAAVAYLLAGPIFNPIVGASTAVAYSSNAGWQVLGIVGIRLLTGFLIASSVGLIMGMLFPGRSALLAEAVSNSPGNHDHHDPEARLRWGGKSIAALNHGVDDFLDITQYLILGAFIAGLLQTLVNREAFLALSGSPLAGLPLMMLLAFVLNLCSEADAFIAASFRGALPLSAQMAFMVLGPMLDLKLVMMYLTVFRKKTIVTLSLLLFFSVLVVMVLLQITLGDWYSLPSVFVPVSGE